MRELVEAFHAARVADEHGFGIESHVLDEWINADDFEHFRKIGNEVDQARWAEDGTADRHRALALIIKGALRMSASRIRLDHTQHSRAETILLEGVRHLEEAQEQRRRSRERLLRGTRAVEQALRSLPLDLSAAMLRALDFYCNPQAYPAEGISAATVKALARRKLIAPGEGPFGQS